MATYTSNLNLIKPGGSDKIRIAQINGNMDTLDEKIGAVGNTSLQSQITGAKTNLAGLESAVGIVVDGAKAAVAASVGQYVVLKNSIISGCDDGLYTAAQAIPANTTIDSTYLTAVSKGGLNSLSDQIASIVKYSDTTFTTNSSGNYNLGSTYALNKRVVLGIYNDRTDSNYTTTATFFQTFVTSGQSRTGNPTARAIDVSTGEPAVSKEFKVRIFYLEVS